MFSCKFVAYFQNTFSKEHLWTSASGVFLYLLPVFYLKSVYLPLEYRVRIKQSHVFCLIYLVLKNAIVSVSANFEELNFKIKFSIFLFNIFVSKE